MQNYADPGSRRIRAQNTPFTKFKLFNKSLIIQYLFEKIIQYLFENGLSFSPPAMKTEKLQLVECAEKLCFAQLMSWDLGEPNQCGGYLHYTYRSGSGQENIKKRENSR